MKTLKGMKVVLYALLMLTPTVAITSCGDDDEPQQVINPGQNGSGSSDQTLKLVKENVSATVSYSDYSWNISIKSNLASKFPGKTITYGVESGYGAYKYYEHFKFDNNYLQSNDGRGNMRVCYPVYVGDEFGYNILYWDSYKALKNKQANGEKLNSDEKDLLNEIVKSMSADESKAKGSFCGRLYAQFDNTRYFFYTFGQKPTDNGSGSGSGSGSGNGSGSGSGSGSTTYEKPELVLENYDCNYTSIVLKYRILNQDKAKVTSAKGYYGTSSASKSVSATVGGSLITIKISGLKQGTTYYVKCSATGKGGTTTTGTTRLSTQRL